MTDSTMTLNNSWLNYLKAEFDQPYMKNLIQFLESEKQADKRIYPINEHIFTALNTSELKDVKVVILGQDPYHGQGQAHGLSFSVPKGIRIPPSLVNIYKELQMDLGLPIPRHGNLLSWAEQGVLLLNSVLTVEHAQAASHQKRGWEQFTDAVISAINRERKNVIFLLWGNYAQKKGQIIDRNHHLILHAPHPSPLSAHRGFLGCQHFSQANNYLLKTNQSQINWSIPE
jgi:uracil-DNA glycosylase